MANTSPSLTVQLAQVRLDEEVPISGDETLAGDATIEIKKAPRDISLSEGGFHGDGITPRI